MLPAGGLLAGSAALRVNGVPPPLTVVPHAKSDPVALLVSATARAKVYFGVLSSVLDASAKATLRQLAAKVARGAVRSVVVGSVQPTSTSGNDRALSSTRAAAVAEFMRSRGVRGIYVVRGDGQATQAGEQQFVDAFRLSPAGIALVEITHHDLGHGRVSVCEDLLEALQKCLVLGPGRRIAPAGADVGMRPGDAHRMHADRLL